MDDCLFSSLDIFNIFKLKNKKRMTWKGKNRRAMEEVLEK